MRFTEAVRKIFIGPLGITQVTKIRTNHFNLTIEDMHYVNFMNCYIEKLDIKQGNDILLTGAFIQQLSSNVKIGLKDSKLEKCEVSASG